jgi:hypothetical protein
MRFSNIEISTISISANASLLEAIKQMDVLDGDASWITKRLNF